MSLEGFGVVLDNCTKALRKLGLSEDEIKMFRWRGIMYATLKNKGLDKAAHLVYIRNGHSVYIRNGRREQYDSTDR